MSAHLSDEFPRMLTGEAGRDEVMAAAAHLRSCVDCQQELVSAVVAHAALSSAQRFAPEVVARPSTASPTSTDDTVAADEKNPAANLPDLSAVFTQVRREAETDSRRGPGRTRRRYLLAAAAAVVVAGAGTGAYLAASGSGDQNAPAARTVALAAFDKGTTGATARIGDGTVDLTATSLPKLRTKRYEVWLTDSKRTRMQPIGWLTDNGTAHLQVPAEMMKRYQDLEVSVQNVAANSYQYSGTSVLRGPIG